MVRYSVDMEQKYERPNTVSGLVAKHKELSNLRERYRAEIKKLTVGIDHLDAAIRLFDPRLNIYKLESLPAIHKAERGSVKKFVLDILRETSEPLTSRQIAEAWADDRGLVADQTTINELRKRITACIKACAKQGLIEECGHTDVRASRGPLKLWRVKEGDL